MIEEVLKDLTAAIRENTEVLKTLANPATTDVSVLVDGSTVGSGVGAAIAEAVADSNAVEKPEEAQEPEALPVVEDNGVAVISEEQKAALRKEGIRIKKAGKVSDFKKVLTDYQYEKVSDIKVKDYDEILEITKSIK